MANVIFIFGLFGASLFAILSYGLGDVDSTAGSTWVDHGVWMIIVFSAIPAFVEFLRTYLRALKGWLVKLIGRNEPSEAEGH